MSLCLVLNRSVCAKETIRRCLSSSRTMLKLKTATNQVAQCMKCNWLPRSNMICTPFIRSFSMSKEEEKEERREKRHELVEKEKKSVISFGHKFNQMGGTKVVIAYFGLELACLAGFYGSFKLGLVSPDTIVALMNKWEFTSRYSHIIMNNPNASLFTLAYLCNKAISPIRMAIITGYGTYVVEKNKKKLKKEKSECGCK
ncbi:hypothetical protein WA556_003334, partial [Blastocystis sp. ATCC 50177/Nand II]